MDAAPHDAELRVIDPAALDTQQQRTLHVLFLLQAGEEAVRQAGRLMDARRCILLRMRDAERARCLLVRADAILGEIARLSGHEHTAREFAAPTLPGHPLAWVAVQWVLGILNVHNALDYLHGGHWLLALGCAAAVLLCTQWRVPSLRLAVRGRWH